MSIDEKIFSKFWHLLCHRKEVENNNDYLKIKTPIGDVVAFNDNGNIVVFDNICPHRGSFIFSGSHGRKSATCPYHGWTFAYGEMIIPSGDFFKKCKVDKVSLRFFKIEWVGDFIFFGVEPELDVYEQLGAVAEILENISFNLNERIDFSHYEYECSWPLAIENALEPYHISMVHGETLAKLKLEEGVNEFFGVNSIWKTNVGDKGVEKKLLGLNKFFNIDYQHPGYVNIFIYPFSMISSTFGYSYSLQNFFPHKSDREKTYFYSRLLSANIKKPEFSKVLEGFFESTASVNRKVFQEDHDVCKNIPLTSWSMEPLKYPNIMEERIDHFRSVCKKYAEY